MKAIMISGKPKWTALIMKGDKTDEIRKNKGLYKAVQKLIDKYGYADIYWYCSKDKINLCYKCINGEYDYDHWKVLENRDSDSNILNGKVVFKFRCYKVEEIKLNLAMRFFTESMFEPEISKKSCLSSAELFNYIHNNSGYDIHISDLEIFDRPRELSEFVSTKLCLVDIIWQSQPVFVNMPLTKAPQNFCYVEVM